MSTQILSGASASEKKAYLTAIASIATADNSASETEINYLLDLATSAGLTDADKEAVKQAALDATGSNLKPALDVLKSSELKFSLVTDLIAFAESDNNLAQEEKTHIAAVAKYLGVDDNQVKILHEYVQQAATQPAESLADSAGGILEKLKGSGINISGLAKGLMSFVGPMIIGNLVSKGMNKGTSAAVGQSGLSNIGSLVGNLTGGKGMAGIGGFLSNLFK
ncbi:MAG: TerB family tellurite resistance protein [Chitinophagaceae bacterium]